MNIRNEISLIIEKSIKEAVKDGRIADAEYQKVKVEYPKDQKYGDYSSPFALESSKILKRSPLEVGEILKEYIIRNSIIRSVDVVKPGFINIFISENFMYSNLFEIIRQDEQYGRNIKEKPEKINIEFVSANPTGPMNIVSARAAAVGDTIGNLLEADGDTVDREFYVNDFGNQVTLLGKSVLARYRELCGETFDFPDDGYHGEYIKDIAAFLIKNHSAEISMIDDEDARIEFCSVKAVEYNVSGQKQDLLKYNVNFKNWFRERSLHASGEVEQTFTDLVSREVVFEQEGKQLFRSTDFGDDKDRVVVRDDGRPTYLLADIAYHRNKIKRGYDRIIDIWGPDHHGYIARLKGAVKSLGFPEDNFEVLIAQQVNLVMEGETVKMSKRLGNFSTMKELIDEIGVDVARYFFTMRSLDSHLDFDLALAKKSSSENPVFYLQYAHARICSIIREAEKRGIKFDQAKTSSEHLKNPESENIMKLMMKFQEEISDAAQSREPHRIASFLIRLAQAFHRFYAEHRVISDDEIKTNTYLAVCESVRIVARNGLKILGVAAPEKM